MDLQALLKRVALAAEPETAIREVTGPDHPFGEVLETGLIVAVDRALALSALTPDARLLEIKCSMGEFACAAARHVNHVSGIDDRPAAVEACAALAAGLGLDNTAFRHVDGLALPFPDAAFDIVVCRHLIHHVERPIELLAEMVRVCRPGGRIVLVDPTIRAEAVDDFNALERLRDPTHLVAGTVDDLAALGRATGLAEVGRDHYRVELLHSDADAATMPAFIAKLRADADGGEDAYDLQTYRAPEGIRYRAPNTIIAWDKPAT